MIGFDPDRWTAALIVLAVIVGIVRSLWWRKSGTGPTGWRLALLVALHAAAGALLHLTLFPPSVTTTRGTLVVATGGAARMGTGAQVALLEAGAIQGAERVPDLATALRRYPGTARIRIIGDGLGPRDRIALAVPVLFEPPAVAPGLVALTLLSRVAPGAAFAVGGEVGTLADGVVQLVDPAGAVVDRARVGSGRRFTLRATARAAGLALFDLRLRDRAGRLVERVAVPLEARDQALPRMLVLAGAPGAELKYLRRWAQDAGVDLGIDIDLGAGVSLDDAPAPLTPGALARLDLLVIDDRRWERLGAQARAAIGSAVADGLGLLLRPTGGLSPGTRRDWAALGVATAGGEASLPVRLAGDQVPAPDVSAPPPLARRDLALGGPRAVTILRDAAGTALASWSARGRGRVGILAVTGSYALVLAGRPDRYGGIWSELLSTLSRPGEDAGGVTVDGFARAGERVALCGVDLTSFVLSPAGEKRTAMVDPASGHRACAAYWPDREGWHLLGGARGTGTSFYVQPAGAAPSLARAERRAATIAMARTPIARDVTEPPRAPGSPWPWFAALMAALALLWWLERARPPRRGAEPA